MRNVTKISISWILKPIDQGYGPLNSGVIGGIASGCGTGIAKATNLHAYAWLRKK